MGLADPRLWPWELNYAVLWTENLGGVMGVDGGRDGRGGAKADEGTGRA